MEEGTLATDCAFWARGTSVLSSVSARRVYRYEDNGANVSGDGSASGMTGRVNFTSDESDDEDGVEEEAGRAGRLAQCAARTSECAGKRVTLRAPRAGWVEECTASMCVGRTFVSAVQTVTGTSLGRAEDEAIAMGGVTVEARTESILKESQKSNTNRKVKCSPPCANSFQSIANVINWKTLHLRGSSGECLSIDFTVKRAFKPSRKWNRCSRARGCE